MLSEHDNPSVLVIGASAGGVEALGEILPQLVGDLSVVVVVHLPRDKPSLLSNVFAPRCAFRVKEAEDKEPIASRTIYIAPPDYHVLIEKNLHLALSIDEPVHHARPSIDVLFYSAADALGARATGIILTGANADGAAGLAAIHAAGGTTVVQDPASALVRDMPAAALERCTPTHVLPSNAIAALLNKHTTTEADAR